MSWATIHHDADHWLVECDEHPRCLIVASLSRAHHFRLLDPTYGTGRVSSTAGVDNPTRVG